MIFIGIDPGNSGAIAQILSDGTLHRCLHFGQHKNWARAAWEFLWELEPTEMFICLENVHAIYGCSAKSTFTFGENFGKIQGILTALNLDYRLIAPKVWQKAMWIPSESKNPKKRSLETALAMWGIDPFLKTSRSSVADSGAVDAALIAEYGRQLHFRPKEMADKYL